MEIYVITLVDFVERGIRFRSVAVIEQDRDKAIERAKEELLREIKLSDNSDVEFTVNGNCIKPHLKSGARLGGLYALVAKRSLNL